MSFTSVDCNKGCTSEVPEGTSCLLPCSPAALQPNVVRDLHTAATQKDTCYLTIRYSLNVIERKSSIFYIEFRVKLDFTPLLLHHTVGKIVSQQQPPTAYFQFTFHFSITETFL